MFSLARPLRYGIPTVLLAAAAAALVLWFALGGGSGGTEARITANVEYTIRDANGGIKAHGLFHNATVDKLRIDAAEVLRAGTAGAAYSNIALCSNAPSTGTITGLACTLSVNTVPNSANGLVGDLTDNPGTTKVFTTSHTFAATGQVNIAEIQLARTTVDNAIPAATNIGAYRALVATLADTDSITVTWTITIS